MASGKVKWFDNKKGFGFIYQDSGPEVFVHHTSILGSGYKMLDEGEQVIFDTIPTDKGFKAQNVQRVGVNPPSRRHLWQFFRTQNNRRADH